jgi:hypothetical protein
MSILDLTSVLTNHLDPLQDLFHLYPKVRRKFRAKIRSAKLDQGIITAAVFQSKKERILILDYLLVNTSALDRNQIQALADAVLIHRNIQTIMQLLNVAAKGDKRSAGGGLSYSTREQSSSSAGKCSKITKESLWRGANNYALSVPDHVFLTRLKTDSFDECLRDITADAEETAYACLTKLTESLVAGIGQQILSILKEECDKQIKRDISSQEDRELGILRASFVSQIADLTRQHSKSYVHSSLGRK